jgi:multidrug efflux pump subunit AcrB
LGALTTTIQSRLDAINDLPPGVTATLGGAAQDQRDAFNQLGLAMLVAIALVFMIMVGTFRSLVQPLILMVSIPFAATGAVAGLLITDTPLGVPAMVGLLMLIGIVVTNAIVLIDLINQYRRRGEDLRSAITDGARLRLRPIIMTACATIFALIPMALGFTGGGAFISGPLAIVVIGGLVSSTVLTLLLVPVLYSLVERRSERRRLGEVADVS